MTTTYQVAPVPRVKLSKRQVEAIRTLITHALEDIAFGAGGSYVLNAGSAEERVREGEVKKAKEAIQFLSLLIENRIV